MYWTVGVFYFLCFVFTHRGVAYSDSIDGWVEPPSKCETCKYVAVELMNRLEETGRTSDVIITGDTRSVLENGKRIQTKKYRNSELRLVETLEDVCERILRYSLHKEHKDSRRFAKGRSETMRTLHSLVEKGVKVELGIPYELWDSPSVEVTQMKAECEQMVEEYEDDLHQWYFYDDHDPRREPLMKYLCQDRVLAGADQTCLMDTGSAKGDRGEL